MNFHVEFPGLGLEFDISRVAFYIGSMPIYWYGIVIGLGFALALVFAFANAKRFGIDADRMTDVIILTTICAVLCARAYYVIFAPFEYQSFWDMINIRDGGLAIYGGVIGAVIFGILFSKWRKVPVLPMLDLAAMGFLIGQGFGRWGNFFNQEAFGTNTTLPWGMYSDGTAAYLSGVQSTLAAQGITVDPSMPVHPTFLYESIWCLIGFVLLALYIPRRRFHGEIALMYAAWYGAERCLVEGLRTDSLMLGGVRISQLVAGVSVVAALALLICLRRKYRDVPLVIPALPGEQKSPELVEIEEETMVPAAEEEAARPEQTEPVQEEEEKQ